ncbi:MAG: CapA family protein [bacterium]|nr:CapA family protein [bacterium]
MKRLGIAVLALTVLMVLGGAAGVIREQSGRSYETVGATLENVQEEKVETTLEEDLKETEEAAIKKLEIEASAKEKVEEPIRLLFAGDIYFSDYVLQAYERAGNRIEGILDEGYRSLIEEADLFVVNQEFPFSNRGTAAKDKQYTFRLPTDKVKLMQELSVDVATLANNHALDFGTDALLDTCEVLDEAGIRHVGAGKNLEEAKQPVIVQMGEKKLAFLAATRVIPEYSWAAGKDKAGMLETYNPERLLEEIEKVRKLCDFVIVYVHWGVERDESPQEYQRTLGRQYIDAGADMVIGSHPHVLQGIEYYKGKPIVYSLGNFIFGSQIPSTMLLWSELSDEGIALRLVGGTSQNGYTSMLTEETKKQAFYEKMQSLSFGVEVDENGNVSEKKEENGYEDSGYALRYHRSDLSQEAAGGGDFSG